MTNDTELNQLSQYQIVSSGEGERKPAYRMEQGKKWRQYLAAVLCKCNQSFFTTSLHRKTALKIRRKSYLSIFLLFYISVLHAHIFRLKFTRMMILFNLILLSN